MTSKDAFSGRFSIAGMGVTEVGHVVPTHSALMFETEAARLAVEDAGLQAGDIDAAIQAGGDPGGGMRKRHDDSFARLLGMPAKVYFEGVGRGGENTAKAVLIATQLLDLGLARYVIISGATTAWSSSRDSKTQGMKGNVILHRDGVLGIPYGCERAPSFHSLLASRHMAEYGTTSEDFGRVAVAQREWANLNPQAYMHGRSMTLEDHQNSPMVVSPYHLLDICLQSDAGTAFIITTTERARDLRKPAVPILGIGFGEQIADLFWEKRHYTQLAVQTAKDDAFGMAGITLRDLDFQQYYDCFTAEVIFQLEGYGWCGVGEGGAFVREGHLGPGGDLPINTGGGLLSAYHHASMTMLSEAVVQLRHEGGDRQVPNARIGTSSGHGGEIVSGGMCSIHTTLVLGRDE